MNKSINVMHLLSSFASRGGINSLIYDQLKASTTINDLSFITVVMNTPIDSSIDKQFRTLPYPFYFLKRNRSSKNPIYFFHLIFLIYKHKINIIHAHQVGSAFWGMLLKIFCPWIFLVHSVHSSPYLSELPLLKKWTFKYFFAIHIAVSQTVVQDCQKASIDKTCVIYNGISLPSSFLEPNNKSGKESLRIINVASLNQRVKGQDILIRALAKLKSDNLSFRCRFVGGIAMDAEEDFEQLKSLVLELGLEDSVEFLMQRDDVSQLLEASDVFVLPSRIEPFGIVLLEAMAAGIPVIASNVHGPAEIIVDGWNGYLFEKENDTELALKIRHIYDNKAMIHQMVANAYQTLDKYDIQKGAFHYFKIYQACIQDSVSEIYGLTQ